MDIRRAAHEAKQHRSKRRRPSLQQSLVSLLLIALIAVILLSFPIRHLQLQRESVPQSALNASIYLPSEKAWLRSLPLGLLNYFRNIIYPDPDIPHLSLDIKFKHYQKIVAKRQAALETGALFSSDEDYVPATIRVGSRTLRAKIRLKGDHTDHIKGSKWSFKVKMRGNDRFAGMRNFSLQAPYTRGFQADSIYLDIQRYFGILAPRTRFVDMSVNGEHIGIMQVEEGFSKELLESQQRREGPLLKLYEGDMWEALRLQVEQKKLPQLWNEYFNWRIANVEAFQQGSTDADPVKSSHFRQGGALLTALASNTLKPSEVFDVDQLARFLALCEVFRGEHGTAWNNVRFYFNPVIGRIEPIGYDANITLRRTFPDQLSCVGGSSEMFYHALQDPLVAADFIAQIDALDATLRSADFHNFVRQRNAHYQRALRLDYPWLPDFELSHLEERLDFLKTLTVDKLFEHIKPPLKSFTYTAVAKELNYPRLISFSLGEQNGQQFIEVFGLLSEDVDLVDMRFRDPQIESISPLKTLFDLQLPLTLPRNGWQLARQSLKLPTRALTEQQQRLLQTADIELDSVISGGDHIYTATADYYFATPTEPWLKPLDRASLLERFAFLAPDPADNNALVIRPGRWEVRDWLLLPPDLALSAGPGTELLFDSETGIISQGPFNFQGSAEQPVKLGPIDADGYWPGLVSLQSQQTHHLQHVEVRNTSGMHYADWKLTGGFSLRKAKVEMREVRIDGTLAEDALNLIRSELDLQELSISNTRSDAYDGDFSNGTISNSHFEHIGGDAIDISGAKINAHDTRISHVRDKAVSIGEASHFSGQRLDIRNCGTAVVSKDSSTGMIEDSDIQDIEHVALMAYQKKPEYGPGQLSARNVRIHNARLEALSQVGSLLRIDGKQLPNSRVDIDELYKHGHMKK